MRRLCFCTAWFVMAVVVFVANAAVLRMVTRVHPLEVTPSLLSPVAEPYDAEIVHFTGSDQGISSQIEPADARIDIVANFLTRHNSPLTPAEHFAQVIVDYADQYGLDYRLIPAIMMQESNLCKSIPEGSHNCLGFGIHARGTLGFDSYEESIERATREIKANYVDIGLKTPEQIMRKYTPGSNGSWAASVNQWIAEMEYNDRDMGRKNESDADLTVYTEEKPGS